MNCKYCGKVLSKGRAAGAHVVWCDKNPNVVNTKAKLSKKAKEQKVSEETKKKISISRKKYLDEHPDQIPYLLNHASQKSPIEVVFEKYLIESGVKGWVYNYQFKRYALDFAFPEWKLDIELDGGTHNLEKVISKDIERDKYLIENGWTVIRIKGTEIKENVYSCVNKILDNLSYPKLLEIPEELLNKQFEKEIKQRK
jgi:very-short-patch-repair endonuclease